MKKPRKSKSAEAQGLDAGGRVSWLLRNVWDGNRAAMARDVGVSHTAINRVVSGERTPGRVLLTAISGHPKVNPGWLLTGEGEPLLAEREESPVGGWALPIAKRPLPGPPQENMTLLSGESFPVARPYYVRSRYWLEIQESDIVAQDLRQKTAPGDLLLVDTNSALRAEFSDVDGRLCIFRRVSKRGVAEYVLGEVRYEYATDDEPVGLMADTFVKSTLGMPRDYLIQVPGNGPPRIREASARPNASAENIRSVELRDIVGVCELIVRRCG